jgi:uncharacterized delta-60 repeat protein
LTFFPGDSKHSAVNPANIFEGFRPPNPHDWLKGHHAMKKLYSVRTIILAGSLLLQLHTLCFQLRGAAGDVDLSFDPGSGVNGQVHALAVQPDGKVIITGDFTTVRGLARSKVARLNADGSGDSSFNPAAGVLDYVGSVALQADGMVLVGHDSGIFRLNSDGSRDTNFIASTDWGGGVSSIAVQSDGKVLIGGYLETWNGTNRNYGIARLNSNGRLDASFNSGTNAIASIYSVVVQPDGKVLVGGFFDTTFPNIVCLNTNGSLDTSFNPGSGANWYVNSIALQPDGKVLIGGSFTAVNGTNRNGIARLNANGSLDSSFNPGTGANGYVISVALQPDGKVLSGGYFTTVNGTNRANLARLNVNGSLDGSFNPSTGPQISLYGDVRSIAVQPGGQVFIGGYFTTVNGTNRNRIARLNADGGLDGSFNPGRELGIPISALVAQPDGKVLVGGPLTFINGTNRYGSARLNADGSLDDSFISDSFNPDLSVFFNGPPDYATFTAVAVQSDGKVLVGGVFVHYDCNDEGCIVYDGYFVTRHNPNGSRDTSFEPALGNRIYGGGETVQALAVQPDGKVVVGGTFNSIKGTNRLGLARLNANGSLDGSFNPPAGDYQYRVSSVAFQPDGKVLINSGFTAVNGTNLNHIVRLNTDGSLDSSFNPVTDAGGFVRSIALQSDGKMLIGGSFSLMNGTIYSVIARLNPNGSLDNSFNPGRSAGYVLAIALQSDGKVLFGGNFLTVNGVVRPYVTRLYGDSVAPSLNIVRSNAFVIVSWPVTGLNFQLQENTNLSPPNSWSPFAQAAITNAGQVSVTVPTTVGHKFFRLKSQ